LYRVCGAILNTLATESNEKKKEKKSINLGC
jgi:hypothetical protein